MLNEASGGVTWGDVRREVRLKVDNVVAKSAHQRRQRRERIDDADSEKGSISSFSTGASQASNAAVEQHKMLNIPIELSFCH